MSGYLAEMFINQSSVMPVEVWIEPFAGGAGVGLSLLDAEVIDELWLTETNPALAAFWRTMCSDGLALADRIAASEATMQSWEAARELVAAGERGEAVDDWELAFAGFFVNRCSRSGICAPTAGPIGGRKQTGRWKIGDRYNPSALADRVRHVASLSSRSVSRKPTVSTTSPGWAGTSASRMRWCCWSTLHICGRDLGCTPTPSELRTTVGSRQH